MRAAAPRLDSRKPIGLTPILALYALLAVVFFARLFAGPFERIVAGQMPAMGGDFLALSIGGRLVAQGQTAQLYDLEAQGRAQAELLAASSATGDDVQTQPLALFVYPPFVALAFAGLAHLPPFDAYVAWGIANLGLLALALAGLARSTGLNTWSRRGLLVLAAASFLPVWMVLVRGQVSFLIVCTLLGCYLALRADRPGLAGLCLAVGLVKPQLVVVPLLALIYVRPRALAGAALGASVLGAVSLAVAGPAGCLRYLSLLAQVGRETQADSLVHPAYMFNWRGTAVRLLDLLSGGQAPAGPALALYAALALATLAALWWLWRKPRPAGGEWLAGLWALTVLATMLVSPHLHEYDLSLWLLAGALAARYLLTRGTGNGLGPASVGLLALHALPLATLGLGPAVRAQLGVIATAALAAVLWYALSRDTRTNRCTASTSRHASGAAS